MILALWILLLGTPETPTPKTSYVVILRDDPTRYTTSEEPLGKRLLLLKRPDGKTTSATSADVDTEATRLANLPPSVEVQNGPVTMGRPLPTPPTLTGMSAEQKAKGEKGSVTVNSGAPAWVPPKGAAETDSTDAKERPRVVVDSAVPGLLDRSGALAVTGEVTNNGPGAACGVRVLVIVYSTESSALGQSEAAVRPPQIPLRGRSSFRIKVDLPAGTKNEVRGNGTVTRQNDASRGPGIGRVEARVASVKACK